MSAKIHDGKTPQQRQSEKRKLQRSQGIKTTNTTKTHPVNRKTKKANFAPIPFAGIDGEALRFNNTSNYCILQIDGFKTLKTDHYLHLGTLEILDYIMSDKRNMVYVGYYLNYDFENWLVDLSDSQYRNIMNGYEINFHGYRISIIPRKIFNITKDEIRKKVYDFSGFFQSSFIKACEKSGIVTKEEMEIIKSGKDNRDYFSIENIEEIITYNKLECALMTRIMSWLTKTIDEGFTLANIPITPKAKHSYGPGSYAKEFLKVSNWIEEHHILYISNDNSMHYHFLSEYGGYNYTINGDFPLDNYPFISSYAGGRIEQASYGFFDKIHSYDIRSAYPHAMSLLPKWDKNDVVFEYLNGNYKHQYLINMRYMGMILIEWDFPDEWDYYPFFYRASNGNVFFPRRGKNWIISTEYYAAKDTIENFSTYVKEYGILYIDGTRELGDGLNSPKSESGKKIRLIYDERNRMKEQNIGGELALKLVLNSSYGKTVQQIGIEDFKNDDLKAFNDFVASWITGNTRAQIWRAIAPHIQDNCIIAIQTDGIYSTKPLDLKLGTKLGEWDYSELSDGIFLMPGIYEYKKNGKTTQKHRGYAKSFDFNKAINSIIQCQEYKIKTKIFVPKSLYLAQNICFKDKCLQWLEVEKVFSIDLGSKRNHFPNMSQISKTQLNGGIWTKPKTNKSDRISKPFVLDFGKKDYIQEMAYIPHYQLLSEENEIPFVIKE
jgi:hypothetical protein